MQCAGTRFPVLLEPETEVRARTVPHIVQALSDFNGYFSNLVKYLKREKIGRQES